MTEERFEEFLKRSLDELDPVPPTPREEMWASIQQQRRFPKRASVDRRYKVWVSWAVGAAATLAIGIGIGFVAALLLTDALRTMLIDVEPTDPATFAAIVVGFLAIAAIACGVPAFRASRLDPMVALRDE